MHGTQKRLLVTAGIVASFCLALGVGGAPAAQAAPDGAAASAAALPAPVIRAPSPAPTVFVRTAAQPIEVVPPAPPAPPMPPLPTPAAPDYLPVPIAPTPPPMRSAPPAGPATSYGSAIPASAWTTPASRTGEAVPPTWSAPAPVAPAARTVVAAPLGAMAPPAPPPPPGSTVALSQRQWSGCGLACASGVSLWHVRLVGGYAFYFGDDAPDPCAYFGADLGRTFCGCWGLDAYYRYSSAQFDRDVDGRVDGDGGFTHHVGAKLTWEHAFGSGSRFYFWLGAGGGYFWTEDYVQNDEGWEIFGELGLGYVISRNFRVRVGVNAHGMDTSVDRKYAADYGDSRFLWLVAPVAELEIDF